MNHYDHQNIDDLAIDDSWSRSVTDDLEKSSRRAWIVAAVAAAIALLEAIALVYLIPLKTVEPYTLLVDRQTGNVEALAPLDAQIITPDAALTRSFLVQYVIARESFDADSVQDDFRKVSLWTEGSARQRYSNLMQANNPSSPLAYMPRGGTIRTEITSVSSLAANRSLVRFATTRTDPGGQPQPIARWAAVIDYQFSNSEMSEADRLINPLGFQVTRYRRDAEALPETVVTQQPARLRAQPGAVQE
ncbi:virB8 family protein [Pontixanthobacter luteolus]|uniref:virB8 family protein n=1 Tax=Pontixanthobacter luteolus TaxID=295089 RepID=UPI002302B3BD|nr:type IV secretion system protein [Pontixanthobacter luteolus]